MGWFSKTSNEGNLINGWVKIMNDSISIQIKNINNCNPEKDAVFIRDSMDIIIDELDKVKSLIQTNYGKKFKLK